MGAGLSAPGSRTRVADVRAWWRVTRPGRSLGAKLDAVYTAVVTAAIFGALLYGAARAALASSITPSTLPEWGPAIGLVAVVAIARWGTWQGPVVVAAADVGFLLGAPLSRRALSARPLARALAVGAGAGAVVAAVALVGLAGKGRGVGAGAAAGLLIGVALLAVLGVALAGRVECSARWTRAVGIALPLSLALAVGLEIASGAGHGARTAVLWSGPWGWAVQPAAGSSTASAVGALIALAVLAAAAVAACARGFGTCPTERHAVRADARSGAVASMWSFDARQARLSLRQAAATGHGRPAKGPRPGRAAGAAQAGSPRSAPRLRPPRRAGLAVPWRDAVSALRAPGRTLTGAAVAAAAGALAVTAADHAAAELIAALGTYLAASTLLEPLRLEVDQPHASQVLLTRPFGRVLLGHVAFPLAVVAGAAAVAGAVVAATGPVDARAGALAIIVVAVSPAIVSCAALSSRRGGRLPMSVLTVGTASDPSGGGAAVIAWLLAWPVAAALIGGLPVVLVARGATLSGSLAPALLVAAVAPLVLGSVLAGSER
jgi:hypothetical protein